VNNDDLEQLMRGTKTDWTPDQVRAPSSHASEPAPDAASGNGGGLRVPGDVADFVRRFVVISPAQATAIALWIVHTHAFDAADASPYLAVTSPENAASERLAGKRCRRPRQTLTPQVERDDRTGHVLIGV
jgi:hypothetical protein